MKKDCQKRHLAAIMFTDIVGYTALIGSDEDRAFAVLRKNQDIHKTVITQLSGTLIKEIDDGMLTSFPLASDAVKCAIEIQKALAHYKKYDTKSNELAIKLIPPDLLVNRLDIEVNLQKTGIEK